MVSTVFTSKKQAQINEIINNRMLFTTYGDDPEKIAQQNEIKKILSNAIDELQDNEKIIVSLYYYDELT